MSGFADIEATEAIARVAAGAYLVDVREQDEWDRGHAPAAHLAPMSRLNELIDQLPADRELLVVCHAGSRSARVSSVLAEAGYHPVNVLGGMLAWADAGGPLEVAGDQGPSV